MDFKQTNTTHNMRCEALSNSSPAQIHSHI